jgi:hypothetical protein
MVKDSITEGISVFCSLFVVTYSQDRTMECLRHFAEDTPFPDNDDEVTRANMANPSRAFPVVL